MVDLPPQSNLDRFLQPNRALFAISVLVPLLLLTFVAWQSYGDAMREMRSRVERNSRILNEHAIKVFETHKLVIDEVNGALVRADLAKPADARELHNLLARLQEEFDQVATITLTDAEGRMVGSGRVFPADPNVRFDDRDWFQALSKEDLKMPYISRSYVGRQSGQAVFNIASRIRGPDPSKFYGIIAVSVDRKYFENFYADVEPNFQAYVVLFRDDGEILAQYPSANVTKFPGASKIASDVNAPGFQYTISSFTLDGLDQLAGFRKVGDYPVVVGFAISQRSALNSWLRNVAAYAIIALLAMIGLLTVSWLAIRQGVRWRITATRLNDEVTQRALVEGQLRQAQKMEAVGRLTGGVAHDFNNLLTVVLGNLELAERRLENNEKIRALIHNASEASRRAATLTARLLAFSRQQPLAPAQTDVNKLISGMSDLLRRTIGEQIEIEVVLAGGLWLANVDPNQLENAILNLCVNARDAMPEGGKLTIETANAHLDDAYTETQRDVDAGQYVVVSVSDTGFGMAPDVVTKAFEPFFTTKLAGQGTGLGLSQVYGFAKQSGGHAAIYSEPSEGTAVKVYLPRYRGAAEAADAVPAAAAVRGDGQTILLVEDEAAVREFASEALRDLGYKVIAAGDATSALRALKERDEIGLLFTDVVLTGSINGRKLADEAKVLRPNLLVLFTTGYTRNAIIHHGRLDEGIAFIGKPFTLQALSAKVSEVFASGKSA